MDKILVTFILLGVIWFIVWWFFGKHNKKQLTATVEGPNQKINIIVSGGYNPEVLVLKKDIPAQLIFNRKDPSTCLENIVFPDFGINRKLPKDQDISIMLDTSKPGEYTYACGMNMFHGKVIIK